MCMGGGPSYPAPAPAPAAPSTDAQEALSRVQSEKQKAIAAAGLGATVLTGGLGATDYGTAGQSGTTRLGSTTTG
jgi:hypothetical protein